MECPNCGFESIENTHFGGNCGAKIEVLTLIFNRNDEAFDKYGSNLDIG
jgi:hypothetical protein